MSSNSTMRPGVFTSYSIEPMFKTNRGRGIGIIAKSVVTQGSVQKLSTLAQAKLLFGEDSALNPMIKILKVIFSSCDCPIYAISATDSSVAAYYSAFEKLANTKDVYVICADIVSATLNKQISTRLLALAQNGSEKLAIFGEKTKAEASTAAKNVSCERVCITYPQVFYKEEGVNLAPAIMASFIAKADNYFSNLNGESVSGSLKVSVAETEENIDSLIKDGVCVFEQKGNFVELIRGVTSAAYKADGITRNDFLNICVILTADLVIPELRSLLKERINNARNSTASLSAILALVTCKLEDFTELGYLSSYEMPSVYLKDGDQSVCVVEVNFVLLQGINQIYLSAKISA